MNKVYLTRRNLVTLLNKLDDPNSQCMIIKGDTVNPNYPIDEPAVIIAVEDEDYYSHREPGEVKPEHDPSTPSGWNPISTAPKDGRWVLVTWTNSSGMRFSERCQWSDPHGCWVHSGNVKVDPDGWIP